MESLNDIKDKGKRYEQLWPFPHLQSPTRRRRRRTRSPAVSAKGKTAAKTKVCKSRREPEHAKQKHLLHIASNSRSCSPRLS